MTHVDPLLLTVARAGLSGAVPPPRERWHDHLDAVMTEGLAGLFSASAAAGMVDLDVAMADRLRSQLDAEAIRAVQIEGELIRLTPALDHIEAMVLQGPVLAHGAYPDPLFRPFSRLDLLVSGDRIDQATTILASYGYEHAVPEPRPSGAGTAITLRHPGGVVVDLHHTLARERGDVGELLASRRLTTIGGWSVPAPSWEAHLVACALRAVVEEALTRPLTLRDIAEISHHPALDAEAATELALRWRVADIAALGLRAARDGLGIELPNALAHLAHRADLEMPASEPSRRSRIQLDDLHTGEVHRHPSRDHPQVAPAAELLRWARGESGLPQVYARRWQSLRQDALEAGHPGASANGSLGPSPQKSGATGDMLPVRASDVPTFVADAQSALEPLGTLSLQSNGAEPAGAPGRQQAWSQARPPRQTSTGRRNGRRPHGQSRGDARANGNGDGGSDDDGTGPAERSRSAAHDLPPRTAPGEPERRGVALAVSASVLLAVTITGAQLGVDNFGVVLVPLAGLLLAGAAARRIARLHPDEVWVGRWLVLAVAVKISASSFRYDTAVNGYGGVADATGYDLHGRQFAQAWHEGGYGPDLENLRQTNFIRWFTGVVYYLFGTNMMAGFFVFGLLAVAGSYFWYRATVNSIPQVNKRLYLGLVLFAPSVAFWPSSIGKESLMQLGIGTVAIATSHLLRHRLLAATAAGLAGGWLVWVVRPHLLALVTLAGGGAYMVGRVRGDGGAVRSMMARPVGLLAVVFVGAFAISQATEFLGIEELSLSSIEAELDQQTELSGQGGSEFDNGGNSLNPLRLPLGAVTVLLRPFPWETESPLQLLASLESVVLAGLIVVRLSSVRTSLARARSTPFLLYCWLLLVLYAATFSSFANFGLLVRQRSLVLPALFAVIAGVAATTARPRARFDTQGGRPAALSGGSRASW